MIAAQIQDFRILIVPGLHGSGPEHWQTRWQLLYPGFERVGQEQWHVPDIEAWSGRVDGVLRRSPRPTLVVAHSFGCLATMHCVGNGVDNLAGALLVAPADPDRFGLAQRFMPAKLARPALLIASSDDPWMAADRALFWATRWGAEYVNAGALGHINADSKLGVWPFGLAELHRLLALTAACLPR